MNTHASAERDRQMFVDGERLRVDVEAPPTGGGTHYEPQTADQARDLLLPRLQAVVAQVAELPEEYKGERLYVETQLLPNYLAPVVRRIYEEYLRVCAAPGRSETC